MGAITIRKALEDYRTVYMPYRNFAQRTRDEYLNDAKGFIAFAEKSGVIHTRELGLPLIERFVADLEHKGLASLTRKRKVVAVRSLLLFLYQDGYIENNIAKRVVLPFAESRVPQVLTPAECEQLREACSNSPRDSAIVELLLQTGIRLAEFVRLTLNDLEIEKEDRIRGSYPGSVRILGSRGKKDRIILLNTKACLALGKFLSVRKSAGNGILFLNRFGKSFGERGVQKMLSKYLKKADIRKASIHTLRHTFGAYHASKGASVKSLQEVMGYKDERSASIYPSLASAMSRETQNNAL